MDPVHFLAPGIMIFVWILNTVLSHRRLEAKNKTERAHLRYALTSELQFLAQLYKKNLKLTNENDVRLLSTRSSLLFYRGNVARLNILDKTTVDYLVRAYFSNERAEMVMAERAKTIVGGQYSIYKIDGSETAIAEVRSYLKRALSDTQQAIVFLEQRKNEPVEAQSQIKDAVLVNGPTPGGARGVLEARAQ